MDEKSSITHALLNSKAPALIITSGLVLLFLGTQLVRDALQANIVVGLGVMLVAAGAGVSALTYLKGNKLGFQDRSVAINENVGDEQIALIISALKETISSLAITPPPSFELTADERAELINSWKDSINGGANEKPKRLIGSFSSANFESLKQELKTTKLRLLDEVAALTRRGNLNLVIGGITTIIAVALLGYVVLTAESIPLTADSFLWHYAPRLTISVFIQIFSFFFLKLYRNSLEDIKYFQNELTNLDSKFIALEAAMSVGDLKITANAIEKLSSTDRNARLQKGESTVALEILKEENRSLTNMLNSAKELISLNKRKS
ncbi:hypothetical protein J2Y74_003556 [Pseudomonas migulae]|uniref:hypothetical protein n=1 Tax=Pseudomonas migulae TaxID=78543 RepID=UPI00209DF8A9|nr:hypothetical protein [Pseudomonas migulae]MCP1519246.1 hypothetical protein [Pseudomonas migulae]